MDKRILRKKSNQAKLKSLTGGVEDTLPTKTHQKTERVLRNKSSKATSNSLNGGVEDTLPTKTHQKTKEAVINKENNATSNSKNQHSGNLNRVKTPVEIRYISKQ
ncbi:uncharacterized protein LOC129571499 [Sitodiplosis mosellana]|uniref:uncharacterized protein LOC129571499 n=1 Tax=Sitodiplosis mosellana TaxID=263140 RepID=UPI0024449EE6|nr:uncharacterized protein LOC129571499 [Sitodiplosis mosellana]